MYFWFSIRSVLNRSVPPWRRVVLSSTLFLSPCDYFKRARGPSFLHTTFSAQSFTASHLMSRSAAASMPLTTQPFSLVTQTESCFTYTGSFPFSATAFSGCLFSTTLLSSTNSSSAWHHVTHSIIFSRVAFSAQSSLAIRLLA